MTTHYEESLQHDIRRIAERVQAMAALDERALRDSLKALQLGDRQLAYTVILRDRRIDELEREIDRLCLDFLVRQQPAGGNLRLAYATIRINLELERIGDYAESVARQVLKLIALNVATPIHRFVEISDLSIPMLRDAVKAFVERDAELAKRTMKIEEEVDELRTRINGELAQALAQQKFPIEALTPLMTIARRFERVSDQAKNICQEALYVCTGEYSKHKHDEVFRTLFLDANHSSLSLMAEAIANSLNLATFRFASAGVNPQPIEARTAKFIREKGLKLPEVAPQPISQLDALDQFDIVVALGAEALKALPPVPRKTVYFDWTVEDPSHFGGAPEQVKAAYEATYEALRAHILDLVEALSGQTTN